MAEGYLAPGASLSDSIGRARTAAAELSGDGDQIELVAVVTVPHDEATLWFFAPASEAVAGRLVERAGLSVDRIVACRFERESGLKGDSGTA